MTQLRIFLSHASQDKAAADSLARALRGAGADVWYDEESLGAGDLRRTIMKEVADRPIFVVVLSKAALASRWVRDECDWAYDLQGDDPSRILLPVVAQPLDKADLNVALYLRSLKRVEAGDLCPLPVAEAATQALRLLGLTPAGQAPTPATPQPSESADDLVRRGKALMTQKQYARALPFVERATLQAPNSFSAWYLLGYVHNMLKHWQQALRAWERTLGIKPNDAAAWSYKGVALNNLERYEEALAACDQALALDLQDADAWFNKGYALLSLKRGEEAVMAFDRALALNPQHANAWFNKGLALSDLKRYEEVVAAWNEALTLDAFDGDAWHKRRATMRNLKGHEEALAAYEQAWARKEEAEGLNMIGIAAADSHSHEEAVAFFDRALAFDPTFVAAWHNKASSLRALGHEAEAQQAERRADEIREAGRRKYEARLLAYRAYKARH